MTSPTLKKVWVVLEVLEVDETYTSQKCSSFGVCERFEGGLSVLIIITFILCGVLLLFSRGKITNSVILSDFLPLTYSLRFVR